MTNPPVEPQGNRRRRFRGANPDAVPKRSDMVLSWAIRVIASAGVVVTILAAILTGSMLVHGQPAYLILLLGIFVFSTIFAVRSWRLPAATHRKLKVLRWILLVVAAGIFALALWLVPLSATQPALAAMTSDSSVSISETPTQIVLTPTGKVSDLGVFFQPGARVDARSYVAILRPFAKAGHVVVIPKQPFCIAFLSIGAFDSARAEHAPVDRWVVGGHSLGGVVAAMDAKSFVAAPKDPAVGLLFFASYPVGNMSTTKISVLSISGSDDGLATPALIDSSKANLPADTKYTVIKGGVHAFFGDYGPQPGDGQPTISHDAARDEISAASLAFVNSLQ